MVLFYRMNRINKNTWLESGFKLLAQEGFSKITIENLCNDIEKTKGSFYHHFKNIDDYIVHLMEYWLNVNTLSIIETTEKEKDAWKKEETINSLVSRATHKAELYIRGWSFANKIVNSYVKKADSIRLNYITKLNEQKGFDNVKAKEMAMLTYATLVGMQQLFPELTTKDYGHLIELTYLK